MVCSSFFRESNRSFSLTIGAIRVLFLFLIEWLLSFNNLISKSTETIIIHSMIASLISNDSIDNKISTILTIKLNIFRMCSKISWIVLEYRKLLINKIINNKN